MVTGAIIWHSLFRVAAIFDFAQTCHQRASSICLLWFLKTLCLYLTPCQVIKTSHQMNDHPKFPPSYVGCGITTSLSQEDPVSSVVSSIIRSHVTGSAFESLGIGGLFPFTGVVDGLHSDCVSHVQGFLFSGRCFSHSVFRGCRLQEAERGGNNVWSFWPSGVEQGL